MATHDYVIANGTGQAVRQDLNNALAAIVSNNSSSTEPGTRYAYQFWADTNANVLKIRNSSNDGWITLRELDGTMLIEDGSASTPGLAFADDVNTGIFSPAADQIGFATGGVERLEIGSSEVVFNDPSNDVDFRVESNGNTHMLFVDAGNNRVGIGQVPTRELSLHSSDNNNSYIHFTNDDTGETSSDGALVGIDGNEDLQINNQESSKNIAFRTGGSESARIDSSGRLLVGTSSASSAGNSQYSKIEVSGNTSSATGPGHMTIKAGEAASTMSDDDTVGRLMFSSLTGGDFAHIQASIDGSPSGSDFPGRLMFFTCADGASSPTERVRIDSSGRLLLNSGSDVRIELGTNGTTGTNDRNHLRGDGDNMKYNCCADGIHAFEQNGSERMRITSAGVVSIGDSSPTGAALDVTQSRTTNYSGTTDQRSLAHIVAGNHSDGLNRFASISLESGGSTSAEASLNLIQDGNYVGHLTFKMRTDAGIWVERARINTTGHFMIRTTSTSPHNSNSANFNTDGYLTLNHLNTEPSGRGYIAFNHNASEIGSITQSGTNAVSYNTSSDHRLKENVVDLDGAITRVKQLAPKRFNFIADADRTVDGFLAHEAQTVVPEAVTGTHNEVDDDGNAVMQGIDQSKLVPLLTAALQEAIAKIETLETKVAALEAG